MTYAGGFGLCGHSRSMHAELVKMRDYGTCIP